MNDVLRAAIISVIQSAFPVLQIAGVVSFTGDQVAVLMVFVTNTVTLLFLALKYGQQGTGSSSTVTASITTEAKPAPRAAKPKP